MTARTSHAATHPPRRCRNRPTLGLIGAGAFGAFCLPHLAPHFPVTVHDPAPGTAALAAAHDARAGDLAAAAACDIVLLAVPLSGLAGVAAAIAPHLAPGALVIDVCSVKMKPLALLRGVLPAETCIIGTHPLFGPQSGRGGIAGLRIAVCGGPDRPRARLVRFLRLSLRLAVFETTPEAHDRQVAHVQGLTHLIARTVMAMDLPPLDLTTTTFDHLSRMVETVRHDSEALFRTIAADNPFAGAVKRDFAAALQQVLASLEGPGSGEAGFLGEERQLA